MKNKFPIFLLGAICVLLIAAGVARQPFYATGPTLVQSGSSVCTTDGTVTNTFTITYSSAPKVVMCPTGTGIFTTTNIVVSITPSNFIARGSIASSTNIWIAVGTP